MAEERKNRKRWPWEKLALGVIPVLIAALIAALAAIAGVVLTSRSNQHAQESAQRAALEQQKLSFQQQRVLADRSELRQVLDEAAATLDTTISELNRVHWFWLNRGDVPREIRDRFVASREKLSSVRLRLFIRLGLDSEVLSQLKSAEEAARHAELRMLGTTRQGYKVENLRDSALTHQTNFSDAARLLLNSEGEGTPGS